MLNDEPSTLLVVAHPALPLSHADRAIVDVAIRDPRARVSDLYRQYQSRSFDADGERRLAEAVRSIIVHFPVLHHPLPPMLQRWIDAVCAMPLTTGPDEMTFRISTLVDSGHHSHTMRRFQQWRIDEQAAVVRRAVHGAGFHWIEPLISSVPSAATDARMRAIAQAHCATLLQSSQEPARAEHRRVGVA